MKVPAYIVDTFTSVPFAGSPTGVCIKENISSHAMLAIANELNFPVTAFIQERAIGTNEYDIKYFTPTTEIPACGHATLASAKVAQLRGGSHTVKFHTITGIVIEAVSDDDRIMMCYPEYELEECAVSQEILESLAVKSYKTAGYFEQLETLFLEMDNPDELKNLQPDYSKLLDSSDKIKEVVVTSVSDRKEYDYLLRSFCPWIGINEDSVTGSVHSVLAGFWQERLNKSALNVYQASRRGGELLVKAFNDKVEIGGRSVIVLEGEMSINP